MPIISNIYMLPDNIKKIFIDKFNTIGAEKFQKFLLNYGIQRLALEEIIKDLSPELELMLYYEKFLALYRREGNDIYLHISSSFRKAAHKIYRVMLKKEITNRNVKFLNIVG